MSNVYVGGAVGLALGVALAAVAKCHRESKQGSSAPASSTSSAPASSGSSAPASSGNTGIVPGRYFDPEIMPGAAANMAKAMNAAGALPIAAGGAVLSLPAPRPVAPSLLPIIRAENAGVQVVKGPPAPVGRPPLGDDPGFGVVEPFAESDGPLLRPRPLPMPRPALEPLGLPDRSPLGRPPLPVLANPNRFESA